MGNLVYPASYDLGAHLNVALLLAPGEDDKVLKYPTMFRTVDALFLTKCDLIEYFDFSVDRVKDELYKLNPRAKFFMISSKDNSSVEAIADYFLECKKSGFISESVFI